MILVGLGSNMPGTWGDPVDTLNRAVEELDGQGVRVARRSSWYCSAPFGHVRQSEYVNGVIAVETYLSPRALLRRCQSVERLAQRVRRVRWGARTLDMDLLAYHGLIMGGRAAAVPAAVQRHIQLTLPHPGIAERPFVLVPLCEIAPDWHHPVSHESAGSLLNRLKRQRQGAILDKL